MKMKLKLIRLLFLGACLMWMCSCESLKKMPLPTAKNMPSRFVSGGLLTHDTLLSPKDFFRDSVLIALIDTAINNNFDLMRTMQEIEYAKASYLGAKGYFLPSLNPAVGYGVDKFGRYTMNGVGNFDTNLSPNVPAGRQIPDPYTDLNIGFRSSWEIGIWGKYKNTKKAAYNRFLASVKGKHLVQTALVAEVAKVYYQLLALDAELEIINTNLELQQNGVEKIEILKQGARANQLAVQQFNALYLDTKALQEVKEQEIIALENTLNLLLGRFPTDIVRGKKLKEQNLPPSIGTGLPSNLLYQRPDIKLSEHRLQAANADLAVARAAFFPSLTINSYVGYNAFNPDLVFKPASLAYGVFGGLMNPLFNRFQTKSNFRRARAEQLGAFYSYQKTIVNGYQEVNTNLNGIEKYQNVYNLKEKEVEALKLAVSASNDLFFAGAANYLDVITARSLALQSELALNNAKKLQFIYMIDLYRSLGGGWKE
jgi:NodT family efflux transporter outer membrane factor (OMF) lipoprotein